MSPKAFCANLKHSGQATLLATGMVAYVLAASAALAATWRVAPNGDDATGDGSKEKPVATIARAVALSRGAAKGETNEIVVADGEYAVTNTIVLDKKDSDLRVRAENPGKALLSGAAAVTEWKRDPDDERLLVADFPFEINANASYSLVVNGRKASLALFPASGSKPLPYFATAADIPHDNRTALRYDKKALPSPDTFKDLDLASVRVVIPQEWANNRPFIATNDWENGVFFLKSKTNMPLGKFNQGYRISNSRLGLTAPGAWMYEGSTGKIRYWPREGETPENIDASVTRLQIVFRLLAGTLDVTISGFVIEGCAKLPGAGIYSKSGAAAAITGHKVVGVKVVDCEIRNSAGSGVCFSKEQDCEVRRCRIYGMGDHGVNYADGGNGGGGVFDCEISWVGSSGAYLQLSPVMLAGNHIHHTGRSAATLWTTGSVIVSNELDHTMLSSRDGGAIYGAMNESLFEGNYCHDCGDWPGLYNDEGGKNTIYRGNRFERCWWPIHMHDCRNVVVTNNTMACDKPMRFSFQGSAGCVFRDNLIRAPKAIDDDPYVANCAVWENDVETGSFTNGWSGRARVTLEKKPLPPKAPCNAFPTKGPMFPEGKLDPSAFATPWKQSRTIDRDERGRESPGVPGCWLYFGYDADFLYVKANYEYNKFTNYKGATNVGNGPWGVTDGVKLQFEGFEVTAFLGGKIESSDPELTFDATNSSVKNHGGVGAKGYTIILAIPLSRLGIKELDLEAIQGKQIPFDAVFFNAEYNETRYYEGPSKGGKPAGVVVLATPEVLAQK